MNTVTFSFRLAVYTALFISFSAMLASLLFNPDWIFTQLILAVLSVSMIVVLIRHVFKTEREIGNFLHLMRHQEFSGRIPQGRIPSQLAREMETFREALAARTQRTRETEQLLSVSLDASKIGLCVLNEDQSVLFATSRFASSLGIPPPRHLHHFSGQFPDEVSHQLEHIRSSANYLLDPLQASVPFDEPLHLHIQRTSIGDHDYLLFILNDHQEQTLSSEGWINFSKVVSHEINNGISPVLSLTESIRARLKREEQEAPYSEAFDIIQNRCRDLLQFTNKYKKLIQLPDPSPELLAVEDVVREVQEFHATQLEGVRFDCSFPEQPSIIRADRNQLMLVFSNLLLNSLDAMVSIPEKHISVTIRPMDKGYELLFSDNGTGIPQELYSSVFVPYFSAKPDGSGIGLSLARQILWKHHASIRILPVSDGCTFRLFFPKPSLV